MWILGKNLTSDKAINDTHIKLFFKKINICIIKLMALINKRMYADNEYDFSK